MKLLFTGIWCAVFVLLSTQGFAQPRPRIPEKYAWSTPADYKRDQSDIKKCLEYLCSTPLSDVINRSEVNAYVMEWLSGSPDITIDIDTRALPFLSYNEDLIFPVIHGIALFKFTHPNVTDQVILHARGLETLAELVDEDPELRKQEYLKEMLKAAHRKKLEMWVCSRFNAES